MVENKILPLGSKLDVLEARLTGMVQRELTMFNEITWRLAGVTGYRSVGTQLFELGSFISLMTCYSSSGQASDMTLWRSLNDEQTKGIARAARVPPYLASDQWLAFIERGGEEGRRQLNADVTLLSCFH